MNLTEKELEVTLFTLVRLPMALADPAFPVLQGAVEKVRQALISIREPSRTDAKPDPAKKES
jgi:hypothetical protein